MKTVHEVAALTGISVRTLHYYDEIGLLSPAEKNEAGYRLYGSEQIEQLQQILYYRALDFPLKLIGTFLRQPDFDRTEAFKEQRKLLAMKRDRLDTMIHQLDSVLEGEMSMQREIFDEEYLEQFCETMISQYGKEAYERQIAIYGSRENWKKVLAEQMSTPQGLENLEKMTQWYGSVEEALKPKTPQNPDQLKACQDEIERLTGEIMKLKDGAIDQPQLSGLVEAYAGQHRILFQMDDAGKMLIDLAELYMTDEKLGEHFQSLYGEGAALFFGKVILHWIVP